jgi:N-acetylglucosaminyl-diphospho-decaprenol L-rhamnosyltransferase
MAGGVNLAVVIVTFNSAGHIAETVRAVEEQLEEADELVMVDNASTDDTLRRASEAGARLRVARQEANLGFAGGCHAGAAATSAPLLLFLNPDAKPAPRCLDELRAVASRRPGWGAWQALVTMDEGRTINTAGNVTHYLGMGWAGRCGRPVSDSPDGPTEVSFASGAALVVRRGAWKALDGFDRRYFMYGEDLDLSLRLWLLGWGVGVAPAARVEHHYDFAKGPRKWFLLERNRWWTIVGDYPASLLLALLPALLLADLALLAVARREGWLRHKLRAQATVVAELPRMLARRRQIQERRRVSARRFARVLTSDLDSPYLGALARMRVPVAIQRAYWSAVLALLRVTRS